MTGNQDLNGRCIGLADDHPIVRSALIAALRGLGPEVRFVEAHDAPSTLALVDANPDLDLLLMDLHMPGVQGLDIAREIRALAPAVPLAIVTAEDDATVVAALLGLGICGFIPKTDSPNIIVSAVRLMLDGGIYVPPRLLKLDGVAAKGTSRAAAKLGLTERQLEVVRLLACGQSNKAIARQLGVTEGTIKVHLLGVFRALNVRNRTAAVVSAQRFLD
jgi:DNA-binding NarL/FixJ family response regulator